MPAPLVSQAGPEIPAIDWAIAQASERIYTIYSMVPTPVLERLGIKPLTEQDFRLADGTKIVRKKGPEQYAQLTGRAI
jgi:hypothetical protein